jgi:hypothetical protein
VGKINAKGRSRESRHVRLYGFMTSSAAWLDLSGNAVKLLIHLATFENGTNNGLIFLSERMAAEGIGVSKRTAGKLFDELERHGLIAPTAKGYFKVKRGPATQWRLTWLTWAGKAPTNEWRAWQPEKKSRAQFLRDMGAEIAPVPTVHRTKGAEVAPVTSKSGDPTGAISNPHTGAIGGTRGAGNLGRRNMPYLAGGPISAGEAA